MVANGYKILNLVSLCQYKTWDMSNRGMPDREAVWCKLYNATYPLNMNKTMFNMYVCAHVCDYTHACEYAHVCAP